jgi:hypothetical protein
MRVVKVTPGQVLFQAIPFPLPIIPLTVLHSSSSIILSWYNRPNSGRGTKWAQTRKTPNKKKYSIPSLGSFIQRIRPGPRLFNDFHKFIFLRWTVISPTPNPQAGGPPLVVVCGCLFNIFASTLYSWRQFLHLQLEDAPCCGKKKNYIYIYLLE